MSNHTINLSFNQAIATLSLNDPAKRNALTLPMFDALDEAIRSIAANQSVHVVLLRGEGNVFCAGFDLAAAAKDDSLMEQFIMRLSSFNRELRRLPQIVVAAVQGAAIAGGCAMLTACDFVFAAADTQFGYPVHRIGVSPAVTIPTLQQMIGCGAARSLLLASDLIAADEAKRLGLVTHVSATADSVLHEALQHCNTLASKGTHALRVTKAWLNELDGSLDDTPFDESAKASAAITHLPESRAMLEKWSSNRTRPQ